MRPLPNDDFVAGARVNEQPNLIAHRARGHEQRALLTEQRRYSLFESPHRGVLAVHIVTHFGGGHRRAHRGRGLGQGV